MPRRVQDIVTSDRRSIRNIPLRKDEVVEKLEPEKTSNKSSKIDDAGKKSSGREIPIRRVSPPKQISSSKNPIKWILLTFIIIFAVISAAWVASIYFSKATFTIIPKKYPISVNGTYIAQSTNGTLTYELITLSSSASTTVQSTNSSSVSTKAQGTVTFYNENRESQRLVAGTRLSTPNGTIYRITDSVTIPAKTTKAGTLTVSVIADKAGEGSNLLKNDATFDLRAVGFKGTERYNTVYAKVNSDIIGGFVGSKKIVPSSTLASTGDLLKKQITQDLLERAKKSIPEDHIMYDDVKSISFTEPKVSGDSSDQATVSIQGTLIGIFFSKNQLVERLAGKEVIEKFGSFSYENNGLDDLEISIANVKDFSPQKKNSLILKIKGDLELIGLIPVDDIRKKLAGAELNKTDSILKAYSPVIESGSGELIPPWSKVPKDINRISVVINKK